MGVAVGLVFSLLYCNKFNVVHMCSYLLCEGSRYRIC